MPYFMVKPFILNLFQWTGDNKTELDAWCVTNAPSMLPTSQVEETLFPAPPNDWMPIAAGDYVYDGGYCSEIQISGGYQEVAGPDRMYTTEEE